jgi:hypothetical protein
MNIPKSFTMPICLVRRAIVDRSYINLIGHAKDFTSVKNKVDVPRKS